MLTYNLTATGSTRVGEADDGAASAWIIQVSGTFTGTLLFRKKVIGSSVADASALTFDVEDQRDYTSVDKATGLTGAGIVKAITDGCVLFLDYTATSGTCVVECVPIIG